MVLIVNDHEWSVRSLESILVPHGYATLRAFSGQQAIELARLAQPDVIVLERRLSDMDAGDVCEALLGSRLIDTTTPIIVTTDTTADRSERLKVIRAGAWEVFVHPLDAELLLAKIENYSRLRSEVRRVVDASLLDRETGLYNARGLTRRARELGAEAVRRRGALACVVLAAEPVEGSPLSSAEQARQLGEQLAVIFERTGRLSDVVGRLGQFEFAVIAPSTGAQGAARLVERIEAALASEAPASVPVMPSYRLRTGFAAVPDFAESTVDPVELLLRAAAAVRDSRSPIAPRHVPTEVVLPPTNGLLH